jgi:hypothetical protein
MSSLMIQSKSNVFLTCCQSVVVSLSFLIRKFMEEVGSGVRHIDPHDIPHFCYQEGSIHDADENEEFDEIEGLFGGFLLHRVSALLQ